VTPHNLSLLQTVYARLIPPVPTPQQQARLLTHGYTPPRPHRVMKPPQALTTTYPARLGTYFASALIGPHAGAVAAAAAAPDTARRTKRGTTAVNYAELDVDDDSEGPTPAGGVPGAAQGEGAPRTRYTEPIHVHGKLVHRPLGGTYRTEAQLNGAGRQPTVLIPIRLDLDLPNGRLHDTFLWNLHETLITPDAFAQTMGMDLDLPPQVVATIAASIRDQLAEYAPVAQISIPESSGEMRTVCPLTVNLDDVVYTDRFEWDLANTLISPEHFAKVITSELGLRSEFAPSIAANIYEFSLQRKKDLYDAGLPELDNAAARQDGTDAGWRLDQEGLGVDWEPKVEQLSREEIEKREIDREREVRRLRRETARFGTATPGAPMELDSDLGRGGRGRVRKRQRSASPTPVDGEWERVGWRCGWCMISGTQAWAAGEGPDGPKVSLRLSNSIGYMTNELRYRPFAGTVLPCGKKMVWKNGRKVSMQTLKVHRDRSRGMV
jgi:chromatin structure-remodeling complex subunit SFH1